MKRPHFPMQFGDTGDTVAELHQALEQLGISVTASEVGAKLYGTDTKRKVSAFQGASGIPRTGAVDIATAIAIYDALTEKDVELQFRKRDGELTKLDKEIKGHESLINDLTENSASQAQTLVVQQNAIKTIEDTLQTHALELRDVGRGIGKVVDALGESQPGEPSIGAVLRDKTFGLQKAAEMTRDTHDLLAGTQPHEKSIRDVLEAVTDALGAKASGVPTVLDVLGHPETGMAARLASMDLLLRGTDDTPGLSDELRQQTGAVNDVRLRLQSYEPVSKDNFTRFKPATQQLHQQLEALGHSLSDESLSGVFGAQTEFALRSFQRSAGLPESGVLDSDTANALSRRWRDLQVTVSGRLADTTGHGVGGVSVRLYHQTVKGRVQFGPTDITDQSGRYSIRFQVPTSLLDKVWTLLVRAAGDQISAGGQVEVSGHRLLHLDLYAQAAPDASLFATWRSAIRAHMEEGALQGLIADPEAMPKIELVAKLCGLKITDVENVALAVQFAAEAKSACADTHLGEEVFFAALYKGLPRRLLALVSESASLLARAVRDCAKAGIVPRNLAEEARINEIRTDVAALLGSLLAKDESDEDASIGLLKDAGFSTDQIAVFARLWSADEDQSDRVWQALAAESAFSNDQGKAALTKAQSLGRLMPCVGHHRPLAGRLFQQSFKSPEDLAALTPSDWLAAISANHKGHPVGVPAGIPGDDETSRRVNYARACAALIEDARPGQVFNARMKEASGSPVLDQIANEQVRADIKAFFSNPPKDFDIIRSDLAVTLPGGGDGANGKMLQVMQRIQRLARLIPLHRDVGVTHQAKQAPNGEAPDADAGFLSIDKSTAALMAAKLSSARQIARMARRTFIDSHADALGGKRRAELVHVAACTRAAQTSSTYLRYHPALHRNEPVAIRGEARKKPVSRHETNSAGAADDPRGSTETATWSELFGSASSCACGHCRSVLSPSAYLADLVQFLDERSLPGGRTARHVFEERAPGVSQVALTCANANTGLPYVDLVNETLEAVVVKDIETKQFKIKPAEPPSDITTDGLRKEFMAAQRPLVGDVRYDKETLTVTDALYVYKLSIPGTGPWDVTPEPVPRCTSGTEAELAAAPQFTNPLAYNVLSSASYPWSLPYNLALDEVRTYLEPVNATRHALMEELHKLSAPDCFDSPEIAFEYLGLSSQCVDLLKGGGDAPWSTWGLSESDNEVSDPLDGSAAEAKGTWLEVLGRASILMDRTGLDFKSLLELGDTSYGGINLDSGCNPSQIAVRVGTNSGALTPEVARRVQQLVRLHRQTGWSFADLDRFIRALATPAGASQLLDEKSLVKLSLIERLRRSLGLQVGEVLSWFSELDTRVYWSYDGDVPRALASYHDQVFQSRTAAAAPAPELAAPAAAAAKELLADTLANFAGPIAAAVRASQGTLAHVPQTANTGSEGSTRLQNLGQVFRYVSLARALRLPVKELRSCMAVTELDPFASPLEAHRFIEALCRMLATGLSLAEVDYLLRDQRNPKAGIGLTPAQSSRLVREIGFALRQLSADGGSKTENDAATLAGNAAVTAIVADRLAAELKADTPLALQLLDIGPCFHDLAEPATMGCALTMLGEKGLWASYYAAVDGRPSLNSKAFKHSGNVSLSDKGALSLDWREVDKHVRARLSGYLIAPASGPLRLQVEWEKGDLSLDLGEEHFVPEEPVGASQLEGLVELAAGEWCELVIDFDYRSNEVSGPPEICLRWKEPGSTGDWIAVPPAALAPIPHATCGLLHKTTLLIQRFGLEAREVRGLGPSPSCALTLDFKALRDEEKPSLGFRSLLNLAAYVRLRDQLLPSTPGALEVLEGARTSQTASTALQLTVRKLADWLSWNSVDVEAVLRRLLPDSFTPISIDALLVERLWKGMGRLQSLGASAATVLKLVAPDTDAVQLTSAADAAKSIARSRFSAQDWSAHARPLRDRLRERQRQALVAYVFAKNRVAEDWRSPEDLCKHYLMDVEMSPCQITSRVKHAAGAAQIFVQRCTMGLEDAVPVDAEADPGWLQWSWMKNYRLWEANRKIFLWPENWIEPELRDDKSPFFKELEDELSQGDVTAEKAERAFENYLEKLADVAKLEHCAMCREIEVSESGVTASETWHFFAKTQAKPHRHYYRQRVRTGNVMTWRPWERLDADIQGDYLVPTVWNRRLYLFWPVLSLEDEQTPLKMPASEQPVDAPRRRWKVEMAWTERRAAVWQPKQMSKGAVFTPYGAPAQTADLKSKFIVDARQSYNNLVIQINGVAAFRLDDCSGAVESYTQSIKSPVWDKSRALMPNCDPDSMRYVENDARQHKLIAKALLAVLTQLASLPVSLAYSTETGAKDLLVWYEDAASEVLTTIAALRRAEDAVATGVDAECHVASTHQVLGDTRVLMSRLVRAVKTMAPKMASNISEFAEAVKKAIRDVPSDPLVLATATEPEPPQSALNLVPVLRRTPGRFKLAQERFQWFDTRAPWLYEDKERTYLMTVERLKMNTALWHSTESVFHDFTRYAHNVDALSGVAAHATRSDTTARASIPLNAAQSRGHLAKFEPSVSPVYRFHPLHNTYVPVLRRELRRGGVAAMLRRAVQMAPHLLSDARGATPFDFSATYEPNASTVDLTVCPDEDGFSFDEEDSQAAYNWELFLHAPLLVADRLSKNQQFEAARQWYHFIFNPTAAINDESPRRYWQNAYFYKHAEEAREQSPVDVIAKLAQGDAEAMNQVAVWAAAPFEPHAVARTRRSAYQRVVVMKYIDNLLAYGDQIFSRATDFEHIQEATQIYGLAQEILGPSLVLAPERSIAVAVQTLGSLLDRVKAGDWADPAVPLENASALAPPATSSSSDNGQGTTLPMGTGLYFCVQENPRLGAYWRKVADRLFKIRHCQNIAGAVRQLPLFEPEIDPALLVKARAAGLDLAAVLGGEGLPHYRFGFMLQKAVDFCNELKAFGSALLSAMEKRDAEMLAELRSSHELRLVQATREVRKKQLDEARESLESSRLSRKVVENRRDYFASLEYMNAGETVHMDLQGDSLKFSAIKSAMDYTANAVFMVPDVKTGTPTTLGATFGGQLLGNALRTYGSYFGELAGQLSQKGSMAGTLGGYERRFAEWKFQEASANMELAQLDRQIAAAEIRVALAERELRNHELQIENSRAVDSFLRDKFSNSETYNWMIGQLSGLYFGAYRLAYDMAQRAEHCLTFELGLKGEQRIVQYGHWDSLKKGLLAGERLGQDLKKLELAHIERNRREFEITKHISLMALHPNAVLDLRRSGTCNFTIPEAVFDMDFPGHYRRRIKSVALTVPCVTGPYTGVPCTLQLMSNEVRHSDELLSETPNDSGYAKQTVNSYDDRFTSDWSTVCERLAFSSAQADVGLFEPGLRDERYLPFEGIGAISSWKLDLSSSDLKLFDYLSIADVVLTIRYTATMGSDKFKKAASASVLDMLNAIDRGQRKCGGMCTSFDLRRDFSAEWQRFAAIPPVGGRHKMTARLNSEKFPLFARPKGIWIHAVWIEPVLKNSEGDASRVNDLRSMVKITMPGGAEASSVESQPLLVGTDPSACEWTLTVSEDKAADFFAAVDSVILLCVFRIGAPST